MLIPTLVMRIKPMSPGFLIVVMTLIWGFETPGEITFEKEIRPIFKAYCLDCHGATEKPKGGLDLRLKRFIQKGGKSGAAIKDKDPIESLLVQRMKSGEMPCSFCQSETSATPERCAPEDCPAM